MVVATSVVAYGLLLFTILSGRSPVLGLDLEGGIAVNLQPVRDGEVVNVDPERLDQSIGIIRKRVDALGVAEPEVSRQGNTILVQLPGAKNQQEVLDVLVTTATLQFRPVLQVVGQVPTGSDRQEAEQRQAQLREELALPEGLTAAQVAADEEAKQTAAAPTGELTPEGTPPEGGAAVTTAVPPTTAAPGTTIDPTAGDGEGGNRSVRTPAAPLQDGGGRRTTTTAAPSTTTTTVPATTTTTVPPTPLNQYGVNVYDQRFAELFQLESQLSAETTPADEARADQEVTLPGRDGVVYRLGPTKLTGRAIDTASAGIGQDGQWTVNPIFRGGENGIDRFNEVAALCFNGATDCPAQAGGRGQLAIVLDNEVLSAPSINEATFARDRIQISGSFEEEEARNLAVALRFGALPVDLEPQSAEVVSATLGEIALALVCLYLIAYYRLLGLATVGALSISASMLWVVMSNLSATVTLAGVVGIVVSIGISLDSSIVFFESLKEDVRNGSSLRSSVERSFSSAYSTILKADISSLIGAAVLYWLSVGPVRGFAFYLGVATLLDLIAAFFFLRPATVILARSRFGDRPELFGIPVDDLPDRGGAPAKVPAGAATEGSR
jgi:preprotein translocase subunit SecD